MTRDFPVFLRFCVPQAPTVIATLIPGKFADLTGASAGLAKREKKQLESGRRGRRRAWNSLAHIARPGLRPRSFHPLDGARRKKLLRYCPIKHTKDAAHRVVLCGWPPRLRVNPPSDMVRPQIHNRKIAAGLAKTLAIREVPLIGFRAWCR